MNNIPDVAKKELTKLLNGDKNFIAGKPTAKNMCLKTLQNLALYQEPYACILSCSVQDLLRDRMFKYQDGHNCESVVKWKNRWIKNNKYY